VLVAAGLATDIVETSAKTQTAQVLSMNACRLLFTLCVTSLITCGCRTEYREDLDYSYRVIQTWTLDELTFGRSIAQFESVFWEPDDTVSLRKLIVEDRIASGRNILEIGTGTGLLAILCLEHDAKSVVATDINPAAVACAKYNAAVLVPDHPLDVRQVPKSDPGAYSVLGKQEKFDLIISNPPWEDGSITKAADHAFYDPGFALMDSLLDGLPERLAPGGRCLLAYGHVPAIRRLQQEAQRRGYPLKILDDRDLDSLETNFLPGMLIEIRMAPDNQVVSGDGFATKEDSDALRSNLPQSENTGVMSDSKPSSADDQ
jgi:release factor glutamine methyltransferase